MVLKILLHKEQSLSLKKIIKKLVDVLYPKDCAQLIRESAYNESYDVNSDGFLDKKDYDIIYNNFYLKYKPSDIRDLVKVKKALGKNSPDLDLDNDLTVTENDIKICRHWILFGKEPKEEIK